MKEQMISDSRSILMTEYMILNPNSDDGKIHSKNGNIIKQYEIFKYLGASLDQEKMILK